MTLTLIVVLAGCGDPEAEKARQKAQQDSLLQVQQDSLLDVFRGELEDISKTIEGVGVRNGLLELDSAEGQVLSKESILAKVSAIDDLLNKNQSELQQVYDRMRKNKVKNDELEKLVQSMQSRMAEREQEIDELMKLLVDKDVMIEDIKARMDTMRRNNIELTEDMIAMDEEMHLVYYIVGDKNELKDKGVVTKEGGILGLGGSKRLDVGKLDTELFTEVDQRELKDIPLYAKKAKLITNHPEGSYSFEADGDGGVESLVIKDRKQFWKASDYLVIEVDI
jgi:hypothetical protein